MDSLHRIQDGIGQALVQMNAVGAEAEHERSAGFAVGPDTRPLLRTLLRLRHDLVMVGRAAITPLPEAFATRLTSPIANLGAAIADYLQAIGTALRARRGPPPLNALESALDAFSGTMAALRREGLTRGLPADVAERFFALGFVFEQMHHNVKDLERCVAEWLDRSRKRVATIASLIDPDAQRGPNTDPGLPGETGVSGDCGIVYGIDGLKCG